MRGNKYAASVGVVLVVVLLGVTPLMPSRDAPRIVFLPVGLWLLTTTVVGALIVTKRPTNAVGWALLGIGALITTQVFVSQYAIRSFEGPSSRLPGGLAAAWLSTWLSYPGFALVPVLFLTFPDGRLLTPRWRWVAAASGVGGMMAALSAALHPGSVARVGVANPLGGVVSPGVFLDVTGNLGLLLVGLSAMAASTCVFVRFRRAAGVQRQQIKWVALATGFLALTILGLVVGLEDLGFFLVVLGALGVPLAIGIAILRYRLYDIDDIINRTLVYGALTAALALLYLGGTVGIGSILRSVTGQQSNNLVVAASTLAVAALFGPLRRRVQFFIDRRFYRRKYDAARTVEVFAARLRDEVDLEALTRDLVTVVRDTMHPSHASLWLRT